MSDSLTEKFSDLDYPGRRQPVNRGTSKKLAVDRPVWDEHPHLYRMAGETREFYWIADLAKALGCSVQSIRLWETKGLLPSSLIRAPKTEGKPQAAGSRRGKRLWTREQIEGIVRLARRHNVIHNRKPPTQAFARDVRVLFDRLTYGAPK